MKDHIFYNLNLKKFSIVHFLMWTKTWGKIHELVENNLVGDFFYLKKELGCITLYSMAENKIKGRHYHETVFLVPEENLDKFIEESSDLFEDHKIQFKLI